MLRTIGKMDLHARLFRFGQESNLSGVLDSNQGDNCQEGRGRGCLEGGWTVKLGLEKTRLGHSCATKVRDTIPKAISALREIWRPSPRRNYGTIMEHGPTEPSIVGKQRAESDSTMVTMDTGMLSVCLVLHSQRSGSQFKP